MMTIGGLHLSTSYLEDYQTNKKNGIVILSARSKTK